MYLRILYTDSSQRLCAPLTRTIWYCYDDRYVLLGTYVPSLDTHFLVRCFLVMMLLVMVWIISSTSPTSIGLDSK